MGINSEYGASDEDFEYERLHPQQPPPWWFYVIIGVGLVGILFLANLTGAR